MPDSRRSRGAIASGADPETGMLDIAELKQQYREARLHGPDAAWWDAYPLPLSTGSPLLDAACMHPLRTLVGLSAPAILARLWRLLCDATGDDLAFLGKRVHLLCREGALLLAARLWSIGKTEASRAVLREMPMGDQALFPLVLTKPAEVFLRGRDRHVAFRLFPCNDWEPIRAYLGALFDAMSDRDVLASRRPLKAACAVLRFRPQSQRQEAIHRFLFGGGTAGRPASLLRAFDRARRLVREGAWSDALTALAEADQLLPLATFEGLLGGCGRGLDRPDTPSAARDYALRSATWAELIERLPAWGRWIGSGQVPTLEGKLSDPGSWGPGEETGFLPRFLQRWIELPPRTQRLLGRPVLVPLLRRISRYVASLLPGSRGLYVLQAGFPVEPLDLVFFAMLRQHRDGAFHLAAASGARLDDLDLSEACPALAWAPLRRRFFLWRRFGTWPESRPTPVQVDRVLEDLPPLGPEDVVFTVLGPIRDARLGRALAACGLLLSLETPVGLPRELSLGRVDAAAFMGGGPRRGYRRGPAASTANSSWLALPLALELIGRFVAIAREVDDES